MDDSSEGRLWSLIRKFFSGRADDEDPVEEIILEAQEEGDLMHDEVQMLLNVVRLSRKKVREIMIPRTDIDCLPLDATLKEVADIIISSGHSRIPIYRKTRDHIQGIVHAKDVLKAFLHPDAEQPSLESLMRFPFFTPETTNVKNLIVDFQSKKVHLAIVLDEYGGTSGLVTFEDVLEEIVGEIEDEYDSPRPADILHQEEGVLLVSGRTSLEDLEKAIGTGLGVKEQIETVGGYVSHLAGRVPRPGEIFQAAAYSFQVKEADTKQIQWIEIKPKPDVSDRLDQS